MSGTPNGTTREERLELVLRALVHRIEELDNPSDQGICRTDDCVEAAIAVLSEK